MNLIKTFSVLVLALLIGSSLSLGVACSNSAPNTQKAESEERWDGVKKIQYVTSSGSWLNTSWRYRKKLNISNPISGYQMKLNVSFNGGGNVSCEGHCNANFSDIRFTAGDGTTLQPYWIEEKVNSSYAVTWIKTSGDSKMYMYYGNNNATSKSNGTNTFLAFQENYIQSSGNFDDSGTLITYNNVSNNISSFVHYKYYYQANSNGDTAHIYTDFDGVQIDDNGFRHPYNGDSGANKDDISTYHSRDFVETTETISNQIKFRFSNGDYKVRIADIRVRRYNSTEPVWDSFEAEKYLGIQSTIPPDEGNNIQTNQDVQVIFSTKMNTTVIPSLNQTNGTDPGGWTFDGWTSTYVANDTATWSHNNWSYNDNITLNVSSYETQDNRTGKAYDWNFTTRYAHDLKVKDMNVQNETKSGEKISINGTILNEGMKNESDVDVQLLVDSNIENSTTIPILNRTESTEVSLGWTPVTEGYHVVELYAVPITGENDTSDNYQNTTIFVDGSLPIIHNLTNIHQNILPNESVDIYSNISDNYDLDGTSLFYSYDGDNWSSMNMSMVWGNTTLRLYKSTIPPSNNETVVRYYVNTTDEVGNYNLSWTNNYTADYPPEIMNITHEPVHVNGSASVNITANITDNDGLNSTILRYSSDGGSTWTNVTMNHVAGDEYYGVIPAIEANITVYYYIEATDNLNSTNASSTHSYIIDDSDPFFGTPSTEPQYPNATTPVNVTIPVDDNDIVQNATLYYSFDNKTTWNSTDMDVKNGFYDNFEGTNTWTHSGPEDEWERGDGDPGGDNAVDDDGQGPTSAHSGTNAWATDLSGNYNTHGTDSDPDLIAELRSPTIQLSNIQDPNLTFWDWLDIEGGYYDYCMIRIYSYNDGTYYNLANDYDTDHTWQQQTFNLPSQCEGDSIEIVFQMFSDSVIADYGWVIDDVKIGENKANGKIPSAGYETNKVHYYITATDPAGNNNASSVYNYTIDSTPPEIVNVSSVSSPQNAYDDVTIYTNLTDDYSGIGDVDLYYSYDGTNWSSANMTLYSGNAANATYSAVLPSPNNETAVQYYVEAYDMANNINTSSTLSYQADLPPEIENISRTPIYPNGSTPINITANIIDNDGILNATIYYSTDGGTTWSNVAMSLAAGNEYYGLIPAQGSSVTVQYYIEAYDNNGIRNTSVMNSFYVDADLPEFGTPSISPSNPNSTESVDVTMPILDTNNITTAVLYYSFDEMSSWNSTNMTLQSGDDWLGTIPPAGLNVPKVYYYVEAIDQANNMNNSNTFNYTIDITPPVADAGSNHTIYEGTNFTFDGSNSSDNSGIYNYTWNFTDGTPVTLYGVSPNYTFHNVGNYTVTLNVSDYAGNTDEDTIWINVTEDTTAPTAEAGSNITVPQFTEVVFNGSNSSDNGEIVNYTWNFTDSGPVTLYGIEPNYTFNNVGNFTVTLNVTDGGGNWDKDTMSVNVTDAENPVADAGSDITVPQFTDVTLDGTNSTDNVGIVNYTWTFTDGSSITLYGNTTNYTFNNVGNYTVTLNVSDAEGNWDTDTLWVNVTDIVDPVADAGTNMSVIEGTTVTFDGSNSTDNVGIVNYTWTFTDDSPVTLYGVTPSYTFNNPGNYTVALTVSDAAGNWDTDLVWVNVTADTIPPVADAGLNRTVPQFTNVTFDGSNSSDNVGIVNYTWTFTDGSQVSLYGVSPTYQFNDVDNYTITLNVSDEHGNWDSDTIWVNVTDIEDPTAEAGPDRTVSQFTQVTFDGSNSTDNVGIVNYTWTFTDISSVTLYGVKPNYTFNNVGNFTVTLNVRDSEGNWDTDTLWVNVTDGVDPTAETGPDRTVSQFTQVTFDGSNSSDNVGIVNYTWTFFDGSAVSLYGVDPNYTFNNAGNYTITLNVTDAEGNWDTDTLWINVTDMEDPTAETGPDRSIFIGEKVTFDGSNSSDNIGIVNYTWTFTDESQVILYGISPNYTFNTKGTYTVTLNVSDSAGNWDSDTVNIEVSGTNDAPSAPTNPRPTNGATGIGTNPTLKVNVSDPNGDSMRIVFYDASDDGQIGQKTGVGNGTVSFTWYGLSSGSTYEWYVEVSDGSESITSETWSFTTNHAPSPPSNPKPSDGATNVEINPTLEAEVSDPDSDTLTVKFFDAWDHSLIATITDVESGSTVSTEWAGLETDESYEWYVTVSDGSQTSESSVWSFNTEAANHKPNKPSEPSPEDGALNVSIPTEISASISDPDGDPMDVAFYDASDDTIIGTIENASSGDRVNYEWVGLTNGTEYSWYVVADDGTSTTKSDTWSFTTQEDKEEDTTPPEAVAAVAKNTVDINESVYLDGSGSTDNIGIDNYTWTIEGKEHYGEYVTSKFDTPGNYSITLTVEDAAGNKDTDSVYVRAIVEKSDWDGDDLPNQWEKKYDLNPYDPSDANKDKDDDGYKNIKEYEKGTDPTDSKSHPKEDIGWLIYLIPIIIAIVVIVGLLYYRARSSPEDTSGYNPPPEGTEGEPTEEQTGIDEGREIEDIPPPSDASVEGKSELEETPPPPPPKEETGESIEEAPNNEETAVESKAGDDTEEQVF